MTGDFLGDRKKALEESFFAKENAALLDRLKVDQWAKASKEKLSEISGIDETLDGVPTGVLKSGIAVFGNAGPFRDSIPSPRYDDDIIRRQEGY